MARDQKQPVQFDLPDNDHVNLVNWAFIVNKFDTILSGVCDNLDLINQDITRIDNRVNYWLRKQS